MQTGMSDRGSRLINDINLPYPIFKAILNDPYSNGDADYSVSQLFESARYIFGHRRMPPGFTEKVSDKMALFEGSMYHDGVEHRLIDDPEFIVEKRLFLNIMVNGEPVKISGAFDVYHIDSETLYDHKTTKAGGWKMRHKKMAAYGQQVNIYRLLMKLNKVAEPMNLAIIFMIKGWDEIDSYSPGYPPCQFMLEPVSVMEYDEVVGLIRSKIIELESYKDMELSEMPYCEPHQRWEDPPTYKVCKLDKNGNIPLRPRAVPRSKTVAKSVFDTEEEAVKLKQKLGSEYFWTEVGGEPKRCLKHCKLAKAGICDFGERYKKTKYDSAEPQKDSLLPQL